MPNAQSVQNLESNSKMLTLLRISTETRMQSIFDIYTFDAQIYCTAPTGIWNHDSNAKTWFGLPVECENNFKTSNRMPNAQSAQNLESNAKIKYLESNAKSMEDPHGI